MSTGGSLASSSDPSVYEFNPDPFWWMAADIYGRDREGTAYAFPYKEENGKWKFDPSAAKRGIRVLELGFGTYLPTNEKVLVLDMGARLFVGAFMLEFTWDNFHEAAQGVGEEDTELNWKRLHIGPNLLGAKSKEVELYGILGASVMGLKGLEGLWAADVGVQARAYPFRPFMFYGSTLVSFFEKGPPVFDLLFQTGVSVGRLDLRVGVRAIKQEPEQSFFGPAANVAVRL
ncbi:hypothetical protein LZC95_02995 [Pendulispora brunnea]|uniref:Uncharacterized protein n=1 Tax=Pendulispora brunnea TaxID=2905690 RepID=A0ABZ2KAU8_9BACT